MITKADFEAHVRAEAEKGPVLFEDQKRIYIAARIQHEWPLMDVVQKFVAWMYMQRQEAPLTEAEQALAPYTTKPTEQP